MKTLTLGISFCINCHNRQPLQLYFSCIFNFVYTPWDFYLRVKINNNCVIIIIIIIMNMVTNDL